MYKNLIILIMTAMAIHACHAQDAPINNAEKTGEMKFEILKTDDEWKESLSEEEYQVLRQCGTEYAFTGKYYLHFEDGVYKCKACNNPLFSSETKYKSGSGWPSFYKPISDTAIIEKEDRSYGMVRIEILCGKCGSHLGHVFPDGPKPTGLRYCVNSISLDFDEEKK